MAYKLFRLTWDIAAIGWVVVGLCTLVGVGDVVTRGLIRQLTALPILFYGYYYFLWRHHD